MRSAGTGTCLHFSARRCLRTPASRRCRADRFRPEHLYKPPQPSPTGGKCGRASKATTAARVGAGSRRQTLVHTSEGHVLLARFQAPRSSPPHAPNPPSVRQEHGAPPPPLSSWEPLRLLPSKSAQSPQPLPQWTPGEGLPGFWDPARVLGEQPPEEHWVPWAQCCPPQAPTQPAHPIRAKASLFYEVFLPGDSGDERRRGEERQPPRPTARLFI